MRRFLLATITLVAFLSLLASPGAAQQRPPSPPPAGGRPGGGVQPNCIGCGGGSDTQAPIIWLNAPLGDVSVQYPYIEVYWCDNNSLNSSSRWIKVNTVDQTSSFTYTGTGDDCVAHATSSTSSVALSIGPNTLEAHICDNSSNCTTQTFTITRTGPGAPVVGLRNQNGQNLDRGLCLTLGAGQEAGLSCGDLFVAHGMPAYRTMGRDRSLTLFYSSAMAAPRPLVAVVAWQGASIQTPNTVFAELRVSGVARASATYNGFGSTPPVQIALAYDASGDASGIYPFTVEVRNQYTGSSYSSTVSGELLVVNRSGSEFGGGWWLAGVEQLVLGQSSNRILWLGGDGSAAVYDSVASSRWVRAAGGYRDTLTYTPPFHVQPGYYTRLLRHGVQVIFDVNGRHTQTIARSGATTTFTWSGSPVRLTSVTVPPAGAGGTTYTLAYTSGTLDSIVDPGSRRLRATVSGGNLTALLDPDNVGISFQYDGSRRLTRRVNRLGFGTAYVYANNLHVTRSAIPLAPPDSARTALQWWDEQGLAIGVVGGTLTANDTTIAYTQVDGPRTDVADVAQFRVDRWGAPTRIQDPVGAVTTLTRDDGAVPALPTRMVGPSGQIWGMTYDALGNLLTQSDSTHEGHGTGGFQTATTRYTYHAALNPWAPDSVIDPEGVVSRMQYDTLGPSIATAPNGHQTQFVYIRTSALRGLVDSVIELQVPTYTDTVSWGTSAPNQNQTTRFFYNTLGNLDSARSADTAVTRYTYNSFTQLTRQVSPTGDTTLFFPRPNGVVDSVVQVDPAGPDRLASTAYDADFNRISMTDRRGVTRSWKVDAAGRDTAEVNDYGVAERRFLGPSGLMDSVRTRITNDTIRRYYDAAGRLTQTRYRPRMPGDTARGDTVTMTYDIAGRMLTATNRNGTIVRSYYREGTVRQDSQVLSFYNSAATHQFRYDRADRRTWNHSFTNGSDVMQVDYQYTLDQLNRIIIDYPNSSPATDTAVYTWDALGRRQQLLAPNGATVRWFYDLGGRLRRVYSTHTCVNGPSYCPAYDSAQADRRYPSYDRAGRPLSMWESVGNYPVLDADSFAYDAYGQMKMRRHNARQRDYTYDLSGNMLNEFYSVGGSTSGKSYYVASGHNRVLADTVWDHAGGTPTARLYYGYSNAGERTAEDPAYTGTLFRRMWYDSFGRMTSFRAVSASQGVVVDIDDGGVDTTYYTAIQDTVFVDDCRYDAVGRRVRACQGATMLFDGDNADVVGAAYPSRIVYGPGTNDPLVVYDRDGSGYTQLHYFITDGGGRLVSYTDSTGKDQRLGYGHVYSDRAINAGAVNNAESFGGSGSETAGLSDVSFFRNRYYDQRTGRWLTEDPIGVAGGANLYQYSGNNPATFTDPFGLCPICAAALVVLGEAAEGAVVGGISAAVEQLASNKLNGRPAFEGVARTAAIGAGVGAVTAGIGSAIRIGRAVGLAGEATENVTTRVASRAEAEAAGELHVGENRVEMLDRQTGARAGVRNPETGAKFRPEPGKGHVNLQNNQGGNVHVEFPEP